MNSKEGFDATVTALHAFIKEYFDALDAWNAPNGSPFGLPWDDRGGGSGRAEGRLNRAEDALRTAVGLEPRR